MTTLKDADRAVRVVEPAALEALATALDGLTERLAVLAYGLRGRVSALRALPSLETYEETASLADAAAQLERYAAAQIATADALGAITGELTKARSATGAAIALVKESLFTVHRAFAGDR